MLVLGQYLADGGDFGHMTGWGWGWMLFGSLFWAALIGMVLWAVLRGQQTGQHKPDPEAILAERFALGEISSEEFSERRRALRG